MPLCGSPVKSEGWVGFCKMIMRADLHRSIACVGDEERQFGAVGVEGNLTRSTNDFARYHDRTLAGRRSNAVREARQIKPNPISTGPAERLEVDASTW